MYNKTETYSASERQQKFLTFYNSSRQLLTVTKNVTQSQIYATLPKVTQCLQNSNIIKAEKMYRKLEHT